MLDEVSICSLLEEIFLPLDDDSSFFDEDDFSFLLDEDDLLDDSIASLDEVSICLLLDDDFSFFDEEFCFLLDEDDLLDDVSSTSSDSSSEIVGVEHATRNAANRKAKEIFKVFIFQNIINRQDSSSLLLFYKARRNFEFYDLRYREIIPIIIYVMTLVKILINIGGNNSFTSPHFFIVFYTFIANNTASRKVFRELNFTAKALFCSRCSNNIDRIFGFLPILFADHAVISCKSKMYLDEIYNSLSNFVIADIRTNFRRHITVM